MGWQWPASARAPPLPAAASSSGCRACRSYADHWANGASGPARRRTPRAAAAASARPLGTPPLPSPMPPADGTSVVHHRPASPDAAVGLAIGVRALPQVGVGAHGHPQLLGGGVQKRDLVGGQAQRRGGEISAQPCNASHATCVVQRAACGEQYPTDRVRCATEVGVLPSNSAGRSGIALLCRVCCTAQGVAVQRIQHALRSTCGAAQAQARG